MFNTKSDSHSRDIALDINYYKGGILSLKHKFGDHELTVLLIAKINKN